MELKGIASLVTGAASGLGAAAARRLAEEGARVALLDRDAEGLRAVADATGGVALPCDLTDEAALARALAEAADAHGPARLAVNAAGITDLRYMLGTDGPLPLSAFRRVLDVNLVAPFDVMRRAAWAMRDLPPLDPDGERGLIVNLGSVAGLDGAVGAPGYVASKAALAGLGLALARELSHHGIRVVTVAPGYFDTGMTRALKPSWGEAWARETPCPKRAGRPEEFADLLVQIARNPMLNGCTIRLDGAMRMPWF